MNMETVLGIIRHALTFGGGFLVAKNWLSGDELVTGVGAAVALIGLAWSIIQKRRAAQP